MFNCSSFNDVTVKKYSYRRVLYVESSRVECEDHEHENGTTNKTGKRKLRQLLRPVEVRLIVRPMNDVSLRPKMAQSLVAKSEFPPNNHPLLIPCAKSSRKATDWLRGEKTEKEF